MFVNLYNKYLNTYLNTYWFKNKFNKKFRGNNLFDKDLAQITYNIENDAKEERIIQLINILKFTKEQVIKYITIYKYLYSP